MSSRRLAIAGVVLVLAAVAIAAAAFIAGQCTWRFYDWGIDVYFQAACAMR